MPKLDPSDPRLSAPDFPHGTPSGYTYGCPCDNCRAAHTASGREYRRRKPNIAAAPRVASGAAVRHVKMLLKHTDGRIAPLARATGVSCRTLRELAGDPKNPTRTYMQERTRDAILAVTPAVAAGEVRDQEPAPNRLARASSNVFELISAGDCTAAMVASAAGVPEQAVLDVLASRRVLQRIAKVLSQVTADDCYSAVDMIAARRAVTRLRALQANWWPLDALSALLGHDVTEIVTAKRIDPLVDEDVATLYERLAGKIGDDADTAADSIGLGYYPPKHYDDAMELIQDSIPRYGETAADADRQDRARLWFRIIGHTIRDYSESDLVQRLETSAGVIQAARRRAGLKINTHRGLLDSVVKPGQDQEQSVIEMYLRPIALQERTDVLDEPLLNYAAHWKALVKELAQIRASKQEPAVEQSRLIRAA